MPIPAPPVAYSNLFTTDNLFFMSPWLELGLGSPYQGNIRHEPSGLPLKITFGPNSPYQDIEELFQGRTGTPWSSTGPRTYVRKFRVRTKDRTSYNNNVLMGPTAAAWCPGIPKPYSPYIPYRVEEWDYYALAINIQCDQEHDDDAQCWIVSITYSTEMPPGGPTFGSTGLGWDVDGNQNAPWDLPPVLEYDSEIYTEYRDRDLFGKPYMDTAGRPFNPPRGIMKGDRVLTITRNEQFFETRQEDFCFKVNATAFKGYNPGYAFCYPPRASEMWLGPKKFHRVTYKVLLRKRVFGIDGQNNSAFSPAKVLNAGMYEKGTFFTIPVPGRIVPIYKFGASVAAPVLLNSLGLEETQLDPITGQLKQTWLYFDDYESADFSQLLLTGQ